MKRGEIKIMTLALLLIFMTDVFAQRRIYHNVGDTIENLDTIYWTEDWFRSHAFDTTKIFGNGKAPLPFAGECMMKCYTETPIQVIGLASSFYPYQNNPSGNWSITETHEQEYMILYQAYPDTQILKLKLPINLTGPYRILKMNARGRDCCKYKQNAEPYYRIYESYIEKPITVIDSFYVGGTCYSKRDENASQDNTDYLEYLTYGGYQSLTNVACTSCNMQERLYKSVNKYSIPIGYTPLPAGYVYWHNRRYYMYTFPILLIDTTFVNPDAEYVCPQVDNFRAAVTWESGGTLLWDVHARHRKWQLRICPEGQSYDNYLEDTVVNVPYYTVEGLQSHTHYTAYVRAVCEHYGDTLYGDWSSSIDLYTVVGVETLDQSNDFVRLMPNPASDMVQVMSCFPINRVSVYDLQGRMVYADISVDGVSAMIDVRKLARGAYVVLVDNQQGICTKKLVLK